MVDRSPLKQDKDLYPFGQVRTTPEKRFFLSNHCIVQVPRFSDGSLNLVQGYTICRHLARKYNLYGTTLEEHAKAGIFDMMLRTLSFIDQ